MNIQDIINWFKPKVEFFNINSTQLRKALPEINYKILNPAQYYLLDEDYKSCTIEDFKTLLKRDFTNWKPYSKDYDCDNFAFKLYHNLKTKYPTLSVGIVFSLGHAYNVFIDKFEVAWYIEPQNDKIYSFNKLTKKYIPVRFVII